MAITRLGGANAITGTLPAANINATSLGNVDVGSWIKLAETNVTSSTASVEFTDATTGVFDGTYRSHIILVNRLNPTTANRVLLLTMRNAADGSYFSSSYATVSRSIDSSGNIVTLNTTSGAEVTTLGSDAGMGDGSGEYGTSCIIYCNDFFDSGMPPSVFGFGTFSKQSGYNAINQFSGTYRDTSTQIDGVKLAFNSGSIDQGNFRIYGVAE